MAKCGFNYDMMSDKKVASKAQQTAKEIRNLVHQSAVSVITIGRLMAEVKKTLSPKVFLAWVECEFGWVNSVASNYMQAARVFGDLDCLKQFQPSAICMLARKNVPEVAVNKAIELAHAGETITYSVANRLLKESGHKPTSASAGKARKPIVPTIKPEGSTLVELRESVDLLSSNISRLVLEPAERQSLADQFFKMAQAILLGSVSAAPAPTGRKKAEKAAKAA